jgi:Glycogen recognition site of AMP-activated protein kinase
LKEFAMIDRDDNRGREARAPGGDDSDEAFVARIAAPLRESERLDSSFERRLMTVVHAEALQRLFGARTGRTDDRGWWRRPHTFRVSPLAGLAAAAGVVAILALGSTIGSLLGGGDVTSARVTQARRDTVHIVRFVFLDSSAHSVTLVGDFNAWSRTATQLRPAGQRGSWTISIPLTPGRHEYAFIVDGRWTADPYAAQVHDDFGTESSVVTLAGGYASS